jgi:hypothetical protein
MVIFARSRRWMVRIGVAAFTLAAALLVLAAALLTFHLGLGILLVPLALAPLPLAVQQVLRARAWPSSRLGLFRDRLVLADGGTEIHAPWSELEGATLADVSEWGKLAWPEVRLTDRLTVRLRGGRAFSFRPVRFGLEPLACRDLMLRLVDEPQLRERLPEFEAGVAFSRHPVRAGELLRPRM